MIRKKRHHKANLRNSHVTGINSNLQKQLLKTESYLGFSFFCPICLLGFWEEKLPFNYLTGHFPSLEHMYANIKGNGYLTPEPVVTIPNEKYYLLKHEAARHRGTLGRLQQEVHEFEASLGYITRQCFKTQHLTTLTTKPGNQSPIRGKKQRTNPASSPLTSTRASIQPYIHTCAHTHTYTKKKKKEIKEIIQKLRR